MSELVSSEYLYKDVVDQALADFNEGAVEAYGDDGVYMINDTILKAFRNAHIKLPVYEPLGGLELVMGGIDPDRYLRAFAYSESHKIEIRFNPHAKVTSLMLHHLSTSVTHETAHIAHGQLNPTLFKDKKRDIDTYLWRHAMIEGVAVYCEERVHNPQFRPDVFDFISQAQKKRLDGAVIETLYDPGEDQYNRHYEFLDGDGSFPERGYRIGEYVVTSLACKRDYSIQDVMKVSLEEFTSFAETEL